MKYLFGPALLFFGITVLCLANTHNQSDKKTMTFGMSGAFTGHFGMYGNIIKSGIETAFRECNDRGGVNGKMLDLCVMEDESNAAATKKNIETMLAEKNIDMFLGVMGTRGVLSAMPMIKAQKIAMFFPWGNDAQFRDPNNKNIINGPGLMEPQIEVIVDYIVNTLLMSSVAIFHADDALSCDSVRMLSKRLAENSIRPLVVAQYNRFTMDIDAPANAILGFDPRIVICVGTSRPVAKVINYFFERGLFGVNFLGIDSTFLVNRILDLKGVKFRYSSVVPDIKTSQISLVADYKKALKKFFPDEEPTELSLTYYACAKIIIQAMKMCKESITSQKIIQAIESMKTYDLQGLIIDFDTSNRHAFGKKVWIV